MAEQPQDPTVIHLGGKKEIDPDKEAEYYARIAKAKKDNPINNLKSSTPVGHIERPSGLPVFDPRNLPGADQVMASAAQTGQQGVVPRPAGSPVLQPETAHQLKEFAAASAAQSKAEAGKVAETQEEIEKKGEETIFDLFDMGRKSEAERILNNKERRKGIEERCQPMDFEDLIMKNEVRQVVPIIPGKYMVTFRSITEQENLFIKIQMSKETTQNDGYMVEKYALCQLACGLVSINGKEMPPHLDQTGEPKDELFVSKLKAMAKLSGYVVADLGINYAWFDVRVRKLLNPDSLGNG